MFRFSQDIKTLLWPLEQLPEALDILARKAGFSDPGETDIPKALPPDADVQDPTQFSAWVRHIAEHILMEAAETSLSYEGLSRELQRVGPAVAVPPSEAGTGFLAVLRGGGRTLTLIGPDLRLKQVPTTRIQDWMARHLEAPLEAETNALLSAAGVPPRRRKRARQAVFREQLAGSTIEGCWLLRMTPGADVRAHAKRLRLHLAFPGMLLSHLAAQGLLLASWWVMGRSLFSGFSSSIHFSLWALIILTAIPFQLNAIRYADALSINSGRIFSRRLLAGVLNLDPSSLRHQGAGQFLGRVLESESIGEMAAAGGFLVAVSTVEMLATVWVLSKGAGGAAHVLVWLCWMALTAGVVGAYFRYSRKWVGAFREMTNDLVEGMVGHRTRLVQADPETWHKEEDAALARYLAISENLDARFVRLRALLPYGWLVVGLAGIVHGAVLGQAGTPALAIGLGGILLGFQALRQFVQGAAAAANAYAAWDQAAPLLAAAAQGPDPGAPSSAAAVREVAASTNADRQPVLSAMDVTFRYEPQTRAALKNISMDIYPGDRILIQGPSGGGKSTLGALLAGLHPPESGMLLLRGLDPHVMGPRRWRKRIVMAPQFHENHIITETLAFNLLMGKRWPPETKDLREAETVCCELGLGDLLDRMPLGLLQMVGESGWRLSHGEQSRVFIARALLQDADMLILDESFGAIDAPNLRRALACVLRRAPALVVIAHP